MSTSSVYLPLYDEVAWIKASDELINVNVKLHFMTTVNVALQSSDQSLERFGQYSVLFQTFETKLSLFRGAAQFCLT